MNGKIITNIDKKAGIKKISSPENWILWSIPFICLILYSSVYENDTFWLLNTGRYILSNGFPNTDPFTVHSGLRLTIQQWLTTVVFYQLYETFGDIAIHITCLLAYTGISLIVYYTCRIVNDSNKFFALTISIYTSITLSYYILPRPQIFSIFIFSSEILLLEAYVKNISRKVLYLLPVLSVLLINLHGAMWVVFFLLFIPYIIDGLNFSVIGVKSENYGVKGLALSFFAALMAGFINPYGIDNMLYLVNSYGNKSISMYINEMKSPNFQTKVGILFFLILVIASLIYARTKSSKTVRHTLLCIGTAYLGLSSVRSFVFFLICAAPMAAEALKGVVLPASRPVNKKIIILTVTLIIVLGAVSIIKKDYRQEEYLSRFKPEGAVQYIINNLEQERLRLYNDFNVGGYLEYRGIKTFIDSRAEVFIKTFNKKEDIFEDYVNLITGKLYYKDFESKYSITHYLIYKGDLLSTYISKDSKYRVIYEDNKFVLYERAD